MILENSLVQNISLLKSLPKEWKVLPFSKIIKDVSGGNIKTKKGDFLANGKFKVVDQGKKIFTGFVSDEKLLVKSSLPYIVFGDHTRVIKYIDFPFAMGADGTKILKIKSDVDSFEKYIYYFFQTLNIPNTGYNRHFKYLKECQIPLPKIEIQKKIATILDEADKIRQLNKELITKYDALTQSLFLEMFGDIRKNEKSFKEETIQEACILVTDGAHRTPKILEKGYPFLTVANMGEVDYKYDKCKRISEDEYLSLVKNNCQPLVGDILFSKDGTVGKVMRIRKFEEVVILSSIALLRFKDYYNPVFVEYYLKSDFFLFQATSRKSGSAIRRIVLKDLKKTKIAKPPIALQNKFAERVQVIENQKQQAQLSLQKSEDLFNSLLQKAFKGELVKE